MTRTCALYTVPKQSNHKARRFGTFESASPAQARRARTEAIAAGANVAIHVGDTHPDPLPFEERLFVEPGTQVPKARA